MFICSMDKGLEARNIKTHIYSICAIYHGRGNVNWDYGEEGNALATCVEIGDNFDVNATVDNDEG
jgi:hypothetical protein